MVRAIRAKLLEWSPSLFLGWNSLGFDENLVRQVSSRRVRHGVVRVNDIVLSSARPGKDPADKADGVRWWVRGVDVGFGGLVRRLRSRHLGDGPRAGIVRSA